MRVFRQFATLDAISGGRAEITAGRGSSIESYPLFGYKLEDYDRLYSEKLELLLRVNASPSVSWSGSVRPALEDQLVVPRSDRGSLPSLGRARGRANPLGAVPGDAAAEAPVGASL